MPIYCYECPDCGCCVEEFQHIHDDPLTKCPECGDARFHRVPTLPHTDMVEFQKPIEMYSIALSDDNEIREFKRQCPDVEVETDPRSEAYGIPIARTRRQKLTALAAAGFEEKSGRGG